MMRGNWPASAAVRVRGSWRRLTPVRMPPRKPACCRHIATLAPTPALNRGLAASHVNTAVMIAMHAAEGTPQLQLIHLSRGQICIIYICKNVNMYVIY